MKPYFFTFITVFLLIACKKDDLKKTSDSTRVTPHIEYRENKETFWLKSGTHEYTIRKRQLPFKKVVLLNASLVGYFTALNAEDRIIGISSPEYVYSEKVNHNILLNKTGNVGSEQKYDLEKIISLQPDAVFSNYIGSFENTYTTLEKAGIKVIFIDEYVEEKPLQKTTILKVFGQLLGLENAAETLFTTIKKQYEAYALLAQKADKKPKVLANEMYGSQWFVAGGRSQLAHFIRDAHAEYLFGDNMQTRSVPRSFEEVFAKANNADYWVNVGNHRQKKELLNLQSAYSRMQVFQKGEIYSLTGREKGQSNDYFESGTVRADLVLKDYIKIFHPELFPHDSLIYMKKLK